MMMLNILVGALLLGAAQPATQPQAQAQQAPPAPAPAPGSPGTYKAEADLMAVLKKAEGQGGMTASPVSITDQYRINIVHRDKAAGAIAHPGNTEVHYIIEGAGTIVTGGTIMRATGGAAGAATIKDGVTRQMKKGDVIVIPANTPHWYKDVEGTITYLEVRFVAPAK